MDWNLNVVCGQVTIDSYILKINLWILSVCECRRSVTLRLWSWPTVPWEGWPSSGRFSLSGETAVWAVWGTTTASPHCSATLRRDTCSRWRSVTIETASLPDCWGYVGDGILKPIKPWTSEVKIRDFQPLQTKGPQSLWQDLFGYFLIADLF